MTEVLDANSFVRAEIIKTLMRVHEIVYYSPDDTDKETFLAAIKGAQKELTKLYQYKNTSLAPVAKLVGHSHMIPHGTGQLIRPSKNVPEPSPTS